MAAALVSIIGPPASGKTTVAQWLAEALDARLIREDYQGNPFLSESYLGRADLVLPAQLYFLYSRVAQLCRANWPAAGVAVSDYGFCQDAAYADINLSAADLAVYRRVAAPAGDVVKRPDVLICLDGSDAVLLDRIARRGRRHETVFTADFLESMRRAYRRIADAAECPVVSVDTGRVNLLEKPAQTELTGRIQELLK
jgi:deoxyadenosine/deoxycytidine kinase